MTTSTVIRWTLASAMLCTIMGCDDEMSAPTGELDHRAVREYLETRVEDEAEPISSEAVEELVIDFDEATVRDIVEGRIDAPMLASDFGRIGADGAVVEACSPHDSLLASGSAAAPSSIDFDVQDELLLDTSLIDTCALEDRQTGSVRLVRCEDYQRTDGGVSHDDGFDLIHLDSTGFDCYICTSNIFCANGQKRMGWKINGGTQCLAFGWFGCC